MREASPRRDRAGASACRAGPRRNRRARRRPASAKAADALIALHARHSAASVEEFHERRPDRGVAVMLTGTDLYRDLPSNAQAARSLDWARELVVLQDDALGHLSPAWRAKARVIR